MSRLEELIEELCPDGVEYKSVGDISNVLRGKRLTKSQLIENGKFNVFHGGLEPLGKYNECNRTDNTVMVINVGASAGTVGFCEDSFWSSDGCFCLEHSKEFIDKYAYYCLASMERFLKSKVRFAGIPTLDSAILEKIKLPIPPLPVQEEIVRILDKFTSLAAELQAELQARKKQYEYYRELILDKNKDAEWVPLLDIADTYTGLTYKPSDVVASGTLVLRSSNIQNGRISYEDNVYVQMDKIPERAIVKEKDILICVRNGSKALIGKAAIVPKHTDKMAFGAFMTILRAKENIDYKYLFFVWQSPRIQDMIHGDSGMPINQITKKMLEQIKVPLPSLKKQREIVAVLEKFDKLSFDISIGLPAEIEARQKQYEYYRDKLLSFKEVGQQS